MKNIPWSLGLCALLLAGCGGDGGVAKGSLGGACRADGSCDQGLACDQEHETCLPEGPCAGEACSGHGTCAVTADGQAMCLCDDGYETDGLACSEIPACDGVDCSGHGTCATTAEGDVICVCDDGYEADGLACVEVDPCDGVDCSGHGVCAVTADDQVICVCDAGYEQDGLACVYVDPCQDVDCSGHGTCVADGIEASCECDPGYTADGLACVFTACDGIDCSGRGTCRDAGDGTPECVCDEGSHQMGLHCFEHVMEGTFVITDNPDDVGGQPSTDVFDPIEGATIGYRIGFDTVSEEETYDGVYDLYITTLETGPMLFAFTGDDSGVCDQLKDSLDGTIEHLEFEHLRDMKYLDSFNIVGSQVNTAEFAVEIGPVEVDLPLDGDYIDPGPFSASGVTVKLRRYESSTSTDFARGTCTVSFQ